MNLHAHRDCAFFRTLVIPTEESLPWAKSKGTCWLSLARPSLQLLFAINRHAQQNEFDRAVIYFDTP